MRITRFVNGKKIDGKLDKSIVVENQLISGTISEINRRFFEANTHSTRKETPKIND